MTMLTFLLTGLCRGCGTESRGFQFAFPKRINLGSIVIDSSIIAFDPCKCDRNQPRQPMVVTDPAQLTEESAALVEAARGRIRSRRKRAAA